MPVKVKICGVRTREIVDTAVDAGADYIGLVFFPQERFRIPLIDPALVVLGGLGIAALMPRTSHT